MNDIYVHTLHYHYYGGGNRRSKTMFPISYGPFKDEDAAREWIRQSGLTRSTKLMYGPAKENIKVTPSHLSGGKIGEQVSFLRLQTEQNTAP